MSCKPQASSNRTEWLTVVTEKSFNWLSTAAPRHTEGIMEVSYHLLRIEA